MLALYSMLPAEKTNIAGGH